MKKLLTAILATLLMLSVVGCGTDEGSCGTDEVSNGTDGISCEHKWERAENENEYTAKEKCSLCGITRTYTDPESVTHSGTETGFKLRRYNWDGYGIGEKEVVACDLAYAVLDCLAKLEKTGETVEKISDDTVDEYVSDLPVDRGTLWLECGSIGIFRLNPELTEICKVESYLGEGEALKMTETLRTLLRQAWYYHPNDYWSGHYENGEVTLEQVYKSDSVIESIAIESILIENKIDSIDNKITLVIRANEDKRVNISLETYQSSDNLGGSETKEIELDADGEVKVDFTFSGFYNYMYFLTVTVDNTRAELTVDPR